MIKSHFRSSIACVTLHPLSYIMYVLVDWFKPSNLIGTILLLSHLLARSRPKKVTTFLPLPFADPAVRGARRDSVVVRIIVYRSEGWWFETRLAGVVMIYFSVVRQGRVKEISLWAARFAPRRFWDDYIFETAWLMNKRSSVSDSPIPFTTNEKIV